MRIAGLARDLPELPKGIDTQIGELGIRLSGGQRQRVGLARAIGAVEGLSPGLLVLDDPFSAVDVDTETRIIDALREAYGPGAPVERRSTILVQRDTLYARIYGAQCAEAMRIKGVA